MAGCFTKKVDMDGIRKEQPSISKLRVPTLSFADKTPTPTKLVSTLDELGIFRDDIDPQSARSTSSNNPFDETFRKALTSNTDKRNDKSSSGGNSEELLNTPQIMTFPSLQDIHSAPSSARIIPPLSLTNPSVITPLRNIAPKIVQDNPKVDKPTNESSAQLLIKMPGGNTFKLSQIPFYAHDVEHRADAHNQESLAIIEEKRPSMFHKSSGKGKTKTISSSSVDVTLKERNKAAAARSRMKRKRINELNQNKMEELMSANFHLKTENEQLKKEVVQLREKVDQLTKSNVTIVDSSTKSSLSGNHFIPLVPRTNSK